MLEERTKIPVVGTVPMLSVDIEEEDSISERLEREGNKAGQKGAQKAAIEIAVIRFPKISNYTDLAPLEVCGGGCGSLCFRTTGSGTSRSYFASGKQKYNGRSEMDAHFRHGSFYL